MDLRNGHLGTATISFTASDPNASNGPQTATATLTVLDHAAAAFANGSGTLNLNFGTLQVGSGTQTLQFQIQNLPAEYRAALDLDSLTALSDQDGVFSTDATPFTDLPAGSMSNNFNLFLNTSQAGQFSGEYQFNLSDEQDLSGHAGGQTLTLNVTADVVVPEPSTLVLLRVGATSLLGYVWRRKLKERRNMNSSLLRTISIMAFILPVAVALSSATARGGDIYVGNIGTGMYNSSIGEYTTSGAAVNASLISGLTGGTPIALSGSDMFFPNLTGTYVSMAEYTTSGALVNPSLFRTSNQFFGIGVSGSDVFVGNYAGANSTISEFTTSGGTVNESLISGLYWPQAFAVSGSDLFVTSFPNTIQEYTTSGALVNASLVSGLNDATALAVSGSSLFVVNWGSGSAGAGSIGEYTTSGGTVNASLFKGLNYPGSIAVCGSTLLVGDSKDGKIGEYTTSGAVMNASLISGLTSLGPIVAVSKPTTVALTAALNTTIITGGTGNPGAAVTNSGAFDADNLNYTLTAAVLSGSATLGAITSATGSLAPSASQACTVSATSASLGVTTISFTASDPNSSNLSQTTTATLTVLDHAAAAFSNSAATLNLNFGTLQAGSGTRALQFQIQNLPAEYRAALDLDSLTALSDQDGVFSTDAAPFSDLLPGQTSNEFNLFLNTSQVGQFSGEYQFNLSDEQDLNGHAGQQTLTLNVTANVVPEPSTLALLGVGALGLAAYAWRKRRPNLDQIDVHVMGVDTRD